jgi:acetate kinase
MVAELTSKETGVIAGAGEVSIVAHRVVHGGEKFTEATLLTDQLVAGIEALNPLGALHNPAIVAGIRQMRKLFPAVPHVAVFDTAFHHTLPAYAYLYGSRTSCTRSTASAATASTAASHSYVSPACREFLKRRPKELRLVSCHLGNGSSLCAVDHGRSVDTTMGFTPAEGLIMGTRCGDVDAGVLAVLGARGGNDRDAERGDAQQKSGLLGLSGISSDMREVLKAADEGNHRALLALKDVLLPRRKYIGRVRRGDGRAGRGALHRRVGQGSRGARSGAAGPGMHGHHAGPRRNREARGFDEVCRISTDDSKVAAARRRRTRSG